MKLFLYNLRDYGEKPYLDRFGKAYGYAYGGTDGYPTMENAELARGYEAVAFIPCKMDAPLLDRFKEVGVQVLITRSIGFDHIDIEHAREIGLRVCNVSYSPESVADYAIMLMLMSCRKIMEILNRAALQDYSLKGKQGRDISNCTVGVIGTGRIGLTVLRHLSGFGCRLLAYSPHPGGEAAKYAEYVGLDELYARCDIITLHAPSTPDNFHMIDAAAIRKMRDGVILVNTARGALIDTAALIDGIESGKIGAAALDVLEDDRSLYAANRMGEVLARRELAILRSYPNVIVAPHTAFYTVQATSDSVESIFQSLKALETGE